MSNALTRNRNVEPLGHRLVTSVKLYVETTPDVPSDPMPGTSGALKTALNRSVRYNDKSTRTAAPKPAGGK